MEGRECFGPEMAKEGGWDGMGCCHRGSGKCQEGRNGLRAHTSPCKQNTEKQVPATVRSVWGRDSPVCAEAVAVQEDTWKPLRDFPLRGTFLSWG